MLSSATLNINTSCTRVPFNHPGDSTQPNLYIILKTLPSTPKKSARIRAAYFIHKKTHYVYIAVNTCLTVAMAWSQSSYNVGYARCLEEACNLNENSSHK
ncbi:hypothetical protein AVEN_13127-1 [Araneus ventricosus]|uniref:Uncharacterized protein n=1 Tax=Araneus ventricosus TaxID=182803 RepID=A0A4Y2QUL4_ARAVE|nr:hypothetical protein AVEN_13127-1 [Araneus ventricosus]